MLESGEVLVCPVPPRIWDEMGVVMKCAKCGGSAEYRFRALEIHTLHLREPLGERRIQALGEVVEYGACLTCAKGYLENIKHPPAKQIISFGGIGLVGLAIMVVSWESGGAFRLCGPAGIVCGVLGIISSMQLARKKRQDLEGPSSEVVLEKAAWEVVLLYAPKKCDDQDITYLPVSHETLQLKDGDLMVSYNLLPKIAKKAWHVIHDL